MNQLPGESVEEDKRERGDLADPKKVARKETWERIGERQKVHDLMFILSSVEGRRFYWDLMGWCGLLREPFTGNNSTFYNCGQGSVARKLFDDLNKHAPEAYLMMVKEAKLDETKKA